MLKRGTAGLHMLKKKFVTHLICPTSNLKFYITILFKNKNHSRQIHMALYTIVEGSSTHVASYMYNTRATQRAIFHLMAGNGHKTHR